MNGNKINLYLIICQNIFFKKNYFICCFLYSFTNCHFSYRAPKPSVISPCVYEGTNEVVYQSHIKLALLLRIIRFDELENWASCVNWNCGLKWTAATSGTNLFITSFKICHKVYQAIKSFDNEKFHCFRFICNSN